MEQHSLVDKLKALNLLKDALGPMYDEHKQKLLELLTTLPMIEGIKCLSELCQLGLVTPAELSDWTARLLGTSMGSSVPSVPSGGLTHSTSLTDSANSTGHSVTQKFTTATKLVEAQKMLGELLSTDSQSLSDLISLLEALNVSTVGEVFDLQNRDKQFNILGDLMAEGQEQLFTSLCRILLDATPEFIEKKNEEERKVEEKKKEEEKVQQLEGQMIQLWSDRASLLFLPCSDAYHFFCAVDEEEKKDEGDGHKDHLFFLLDISASMNHDEKGTYQAPKSPDHAASSIKKARELLVPLVLGALKRNSAVSVVLWNSRISGLISFFPHDYIDKETGELWDTDALTTDIISRTSISAFTARGATNIEAALQFISENTQKLSQKCKSITVWFLTDGEETFYLEPDGKPTRIPTNKTDPLFTYFNSELKNGLTKYQVKMVGMMEKLMENMRESRCTTTFHWCHFGEAHPLFLRELRKATDGHFHAVADINKLKEEVSSEALAPTYKLTIILPDSGTKIPVSAAITETAVYGRGQVDRNRFVEAMSNKKVILKTEQEEMNLDAYTFFPVSDKMKDGIQQILSLEPSLSDMITKVSENINPSMLNKVTRQLKELRIQRNEAIALVSKSVKSGSLVQLFLEKSLETIESQISALERLIEGYLKPLGEKYDEQSVKKNDYFSVREQMAISAGLESMKVRLGSGIASTSLDRRVQRLVATNGTWARSMLNRKCLLAENVSPNDPDKTILNLIVMDGPELRARQQAIKKKIVVESSHEKLKDLFPDTKELRSADATIEEKFKIRDGKLMSVLTVFLPFGGETLSLMHTLPTFELYPKRIGDYSVEVDTADLDEARDRMLDPLSYSNFLELIAEENTLPAFLYTIRPEQTIGLIFNTLEMLAVESGGSDSTSFSYFRLFWRLAEQDPVTKAVQVPGTFSKANMALPMAPEPLTNLVFSSLMPGLMSEFVTGTPMAPLAGVGLMYIGFLLMHMRAQNISGVDIARIGDILSSLACWIDNPKTNPKKEDVLDIIGRAVKAKAIPSADAPGKTVPTKAVAYFLMDSSIPVELRYAALHEETYQRYMKLLLGKNKGAVAGKNTPQQLIDNQLFSHELVADILKELCGIPEKDAIKSSESGFELEVDGDGIPVKFLTVSEQLNTLLNFKEGEGEKEIVEFLKNPNNIKILGQKLRYVLHVVGPKALYKGSWWESIQRLYFVWNVLASFPIEQLKSTYAAFKEALDFQAHCKKQLENVSNIAFDNTLCSWADEKGFYTLEWISNELFVISHNNNEKVSASNPNHVPLILKFWDAVKGMLTIYKWKSRGSNGYGLLEIDYDVVRALKDHSGKLAGQLQQTQQAEYRAAKEWRNQKYDRWAPPRPKIAQLGNNIQAVQGPREFSNKKRISIVIIGNVDAGKSTTSGRIISDCGFIDPHMISLFEKEARNLGKASFKYAWVMDKLKAERELGKTIEVSLWNIETKKYEVDILDAPGHKAFYKNMAVGASLADAATLIVSAEPGEFESGIGKGGMTIEEALCAYTVGVRQFIIAVNKMDTVNYSEERFVEIVNNIKRLFKRNYISIPDNKIIALPMSAFCGENVTEPCDKFPWFKGWQYTYKDGTVATGKTLLEAIDAIELPVRAVNEPLRIPILKVHSIPGIGTVAVGRIASGTLKSGAKLLIQPDKIPTDVTTIELHHVSRKEGTPGELIGFKVRGVKAADLYRGMVAVGAERSIEPVNRFLVQVVIINHPGSLTPGFVSYCYCHTATFPAKWAEFRSKKDRTGKVIENNPKELKQGEVGVIEMVTEKYVCIETFNACPPLGRLALTTGKSVVAIGRIEEILPPLKQDRTASKIKGKYF